MSWNYRVVKREHKVPILDDEVHITYGIHEVYYNEAGEPKSCTVEPVEICGESPGDLRWTLERMSAALHKGILDYDSFTITVHEGKTETP